MLHPFFVRFSYILQSGAGALLCFLFDALLVTAILTPESLDKLSGLYAILKSSGNQINPLSHNSTEKKAAKDVICSPTTRYDHQRLL
jgi:hypothetical protein